MALKTGGPLPLVAWGGLFVAWLHNVWGSLRLVAYTAGGLFLVLGGLFCVSVWGVVCAKLREIVSGGPRIQMGVPIYKYIYNFTCMYMRAPIYNYYYIYK